MNAKHRSTGTDHVLLSRPPDSVGPKKGRRLCVMSSGADDPSYAIASDLGESGLKCLVGFRQLIA
jgi:hypothetical protein